MQNLDNRNLEFEGLPINLEYERLVISGLVIDGTAYARVEAILSPECFSDGRHRAIYRAVKNLSNSDKPISFLSVINELRNKNDLGIAGGLQYVSEVSSIASSTSRIEYYVRVLYDLKLKREALDMGKRIVHEALDPTTDITEILHTAETKLAEMSTGAVTDGVKAIGELLPNVLEQIDRASKSDSGLVGIPTGFTELDSYISGWRPTDLVVIAGRPGMGKTALAVSLARSLSVDYQVPTLFFSLEMGELQVGTRLLVAQSEVPNELVKVGRLNDHQAGAIMSATTQLEQAPIYVDDNASISIYEIRSKARKYVRDFGVKVVIIDYLQLMTMPTHERGRSREQEVASISRSLKILAKELDITIIALSQLNRGVEQRGDKNKRPMLSDLRESGAIEQDADMVLFTHRPEYYGITEDESGADMRGKAELIIAKQRDGRTGIINLNFQADTMRFRDYTTSSVVSFSISEREDLPF